jgi:hypothetical protein
MTKYLPVAIGLVVIGTGTYLQGIWSERWGKYHTEELAQFTQRLSQVPTVIGDWEGRDQTVNAEEFAASHCDGCVSRDYTSRRSGATVSVFLVSGTGRHVTIHTPDWCYRGAGYEIDATPNPYAIDVNGIEPRPEFRTATFTKQEATGTDRLRIFWSFSHDGVWEGPARPKPKYGRLPALYKVYFITKAAMRRETAEDSPTVEFAKEFFPAVNKILFPPAGGKDEGRRTKDEGRSK